MCCCSDEMCVLGDAFESNPDLAERLRAEGVRTVVALGIQSECCVLATCKGALAAGFEVRLLKGAHSTYDSGGKSAVEIEREVEAELERAGVEIMTWREMQAYLWAWKHYLDSEAQP
jgi:nicotinamidase-related amidase